MIDYSLTLLFSPPHDFYLFTASRLDYDGKLDWSLLRKHCREVILHPVDNIKDKALMLDLVKDADIVITKEMHVPANYFAEFSSTIKLLCEAGTGYNNLPIQQARNAGIPVCNIPTYSTEAVAHMAINYIMNFSVSMFDQQRMLLQNDRSNFTGPFTLPLHEINRNQSGRDWTGTWNECHY
jgi:glycerate dehydrogenase